MSLDPRRKDEAVLLLGFGGPERFEDVRPFIDKVVAGRNVPESRIEAVVEQYRQIGGRSPFNELTDRQARALEQRLADDSSAVAVYTGMLNWHPSIEATISRMSADGIKRASGIVLAPHRTQSSFERYTQAVESAVQRLAHNIDVQYAPPWHSEPLFIEAVTARVTHCLEQLDEAARSRCHLIFTAHSVPVEMSVQSGYAEQINFSAELVAEELEHKHGLALPWAVGYQSRSGAPTQPWLEPDVETQIQAAQQSGCTHVLLVPIGFVCDHVEVLFDLDVLAANTALAAGITMIRAQTVSDHPAFIRMLAHLAQQSLESFYAKPERK